ncbi:MAG: anaerobic ribonucleoside-triphosphate reductase [Candidatus Thorarchaeota archaeon]
MKIPCEIYSRPCGYFRPVDQWNRGKQQEFKDRKYYNFPNLKEEGDMSKIKYSHIVEKLVEISDRFNDWELGFICDMYNNRDDSFSEREKEKILELNNKYRKSN